LSPAGDDSALVAAVTAVKPAGIVVYYVVSDSPRWQDATLTWGAVAGTVTWDNVQAGDV
jgi:ABC-type sugar transport system substrate-binding protein